MSVAMSGSDTIKINDRLLSDFADGDVLSITFPNEIATVKTGKNKNAVYGLNESGNQSEVMLRILRGSPDDKFLNNLYAQQQANFAGFVLMTGEATKRVGDGKGKIIPDNYLLSGGVFTKPVEAKSNVEGDSEQSVAIYHMKFALSPRVIG